VVGVGFVDGQVDHEEVVTAQCAAQMACGVARLMGADFAVAVTGVGVRIRMRDTRLGR